MHASRWFKIFLITFTSLGLGRIQVGWADSYYSSIGLGLPRYFVSQKAAGMGGAGIGIAETLSLNAMNPAANEINSATCLAIQFEYEYANSQSDIGKVNTANGNAAGVQFMFPVKKRLTFISLIQPLTISRYLLKAEQRADTLDFARTIKGNGGLSVGSLGLQYGLRDKVYFAALINFNFGSVNEEWDLLFDQADYLDSKDRYNSHLSGLSYDLGLWLKPFKRWALGGVYKTGCDLDQRTDIRAGSGYTETLPKGTIHYPQAFGVGCSYAVASWQWAVDYYLQNWSRYRVNGRLREDFKDYQRFSAGVEWLRSNRPTERYSQRIAYRLGVYYAQLPYTNSSGNSVNEKFVTAGLSLPFQMNNGRVEFAVEAGVRGDRSQFLYQENVYRFTISLMGGERWFIRR